MTSICNKYKNTPQKNYGKSAIHTSEMFNVWLYSHQSSYYLFRHTAYRFMTFQYFLLKLAVIKLLLKWRKIIQFEWYVLQETFIDLQCLILTPYTIRLIIYQLRDRFYIWDTIDMVDGCKSVKKDYRGAFD